ncbi:hypothetical protein B7463_g4218, partial [Scytalidium lignicola]
MWTRCGITLLLNGLQISLAQIEAFNNPPYLPTFPLSIKYTRVTVDSKKVVPTEQELENFDLSNPVIVELIHYAQEGDEADRQLTVRQALKKYKKAVFWPMFLSTSLIMEGYDLVIITSFYGQTQFQNRFGVYDRGSGQKVIIAAWQSGLSNSPFRLSTYDDGIYGMDGSDGFYSRLSLPILAWGEAMCGVSWGVFQTLSTTYASKVVPTVLRLYVTAYVCIEGDLGWRLPFVLQWVWSIPLCIGAYLAPESPWNAVRRDKVGMARRSLLRLREDTPYRELGVDATLAYIRAQIYGGPKSFAQGNSAEMAVGILLVISTLCNMIIIGPACYPVVAETPSGRLRYKTIVIGRFVYNLTGIFSNSVTPRMISALTNLLCNIWCWFRLPETKDRVFGEIDVLFDNKVPARKFKYTKVDQFAHQNDYEAKASGI